MTMIAVPIWLLICDGADDDDDGGAVVVDAAAVVVVLMTLLYRVQFLLGDK